MEEKNSEFRVAILVDVNESYVYIICILYIFTGIYVFKSSSGTRHWSDAKGMNIRESHCLGRNIFFLPCHSMPFLDNNRLFQSIKGT